MYRLNRAGFVPESLLIVLLSATAGSCGQSSPLSTGGAVRFLVIGDFGTGEPPQMLVAQGMAQVCADRGCDFIVSTGDNIYDQPQSPNDPRFERNFEIPYADLDAPWYLSLGNHDIGDATGVNGDGGDHEVAYSYRTDRLSEKWHMPARWYHVRIGPVALFALDTNLVSADGVTGDDDSTWESEQKPFLNSALTASDAPWKFAFGHHPYRSNGGHQNPPEQFQDRLEATVCGNVDAYFSGHDHILAWMEQAPECAGTELLISGAGGQTPDLTESPQTNPVHYHAFNQYGFLHIEVSGGSLTGTFYDENGQLLYERTVTKLDDTES